MLEIHHDRRYLSIGQTDLNEILGLDSGLRMFCLAKNEDFMK